MQKGGKGDKRRETSERVETEKGRKCFRKEFKALEKMGEKRKEFVGKERLKKTIKRRKEMKRAARKIHQVGE